MLNSPDHLSMSGLLFKSRNYYESYPVIISCARSSSVRFPNKHIQVLNNGMTVIENLLDNVRKTSMLAVIAIPYEDFNSELHDHLRILQAKYEFCIYFGSKSDVLGRMTAAANALHKFCNIDPIIRVTADCPLASNSLIIDMHEGWKICDTPILSNVFPSRTFAKGLDVELISYEFINYLNGLNLTKEEREHVTKYVYDKKSDLVTEFSNNGKYDGNKSTSLCVDNPKDISIINRYLANRR